MKTLESLNLTGELPSPKGVALAVLELCRREDATTAEIARIVQTDPALSGRLIRLANSVVSNGRAVASVPDAILKVGMVALRQIVLGFSLVDQSLSGPCHAFDYRRFWSQSLLMALAAQRLGSVCRVGVMDELFACGLLAQVGQLALATMYPGEYAAILEAARAGGRLVDLEREALHTDHAELTAALLMDWGLPKVLVEPVYYHEAPEESGFSEGSRPHQLTHLLHMARQVAELGVAPEGERADRVARLMLLGGRIGLNSEDVGSMVDDLVRQWCEWGEMLDVPSSVLPPFDDMARQNGTKEAVDPQTLRVLVVAADPVELAAMKGIFADTLGHVVFTADNGEEALAVAVEAMPQVVVAEQAMPAMDGLELCRALRATEWGQGMYVILLADRDGEDEILKAFEAGADDCVPKPVGVPSLRARLRAAWHYVRLLEAWERDRAQLKQFAAELAISNRRLERVAMTDLLTDLPNRRAGMEALEQAWNGAARTGQPLSVLLLDIDHFKKVNDDHGHAVGDQVLREVAAALKAAVRRNESVCRLGGEEFLLICRDTDLRTGLLAGERLRRVIAALTIHIGGTVVRPTLSIGVASREADTANPDALVHAADQALYAAKRAGRNRVCIMSHGHLVTPTR